MNYEIRRKYHYQGYVFLCSVTPIACYWSAHLCEADPKRFTLWDAKMLFQNAHNKQIQGLIQESLQSESDEFKDISIMDITTQTS